MSVANPECRPLTATLSGTASTRRWTLTQARARFSEVVRLACSESPQLVSVRGQDAVVVISVEALERMSRPLPLLPLVAFMESLHLDGLDPVREPQSARDAAL